jgi:hypothetical protein
MSIVTFQFLFFFYEWCRPFISFEEISPSGLISAWGQICFINGVVHGTIRQVVGTRVRIGPQYSLLVLTCDLVEKSAKSQVPCHSWRDTIQDPPCLKAVSADHIKDYQGYFALFTNNVDVSVLQEVKLIYDYMYNRNNLAAFIADIVGFNDIFRLFKIIVDFASTRYH